MTLARGASLLALSTLALTTFVITPASAQRVPTLPDPISCKGTGRVSSALEVSIEIFAATTRGTNGNPLSTVRVLRSERAGSSLEFKKTLEMTIPLTSVQPMFPVYSFQGRQDRRLVDGSLLDVKVAISNEVIRPGVENPSRISLEFKGSGFRADPTKPPKAYDDKIDGTCVFKPLSAPR